MTISLTLTLYEYDSKNKQENEQQGIKAHITLMLIKKSGFNFKVLIFSICSETVMYSSEREGNPLRM